MQRVTIYGVSFDVVGKQPIVLLRTVDGARFLPIWVGHAEAQAILMRLQGVEPPRPMTHDLLAALVRDLGAVVEQVEVTDLRDNTYYARIVVSRGDDRLRVDARPSDAIALALRCDAPILVADEIIASSSIEMEDPNDAVPEDQIEEFRRFLEDVGPDDFRS